MFEVSVIDAAGDEQALRTNNPDRAVNWLSRWADAKHQPLEVVFTLLGNGQVQASDETKVLS